MGNVTTEDAVRTHARTLFDAVRFTSPAPVAHTPFLRAWLDAGMNGAMAYLEKRHKLRTGPLDSPRLLEGAKSVIVVAVSYDFRDTSGPIARYARGEDYHRVLWDKLNALEAWLSESYPGTRARGYADSGPIRERELAARAGLGWQGKHTNLISLDLGNWFFLGALLTTLALTPDPSFDGDHCGTCTRCLTACPTGALVAPQTLDARRCISYLTIELHGAIPIELRPLMSDHIFGCDDCLAACPWNERAQLGRESRLAARDVRAGHPDLLALLTELETDEGFQARFAGTPLLRPGRAGLRRNVCVALGNVGGSDAIPALHRAATTDPSELVREHALWALERLSLRLAPSP